MFKRRDIIVNNKGARFRVLSSNDSGPYDGDRYKIKMLSKPIPGYPYPKISYPKKGWLHSEFKLYKRLDLGSKRENVQKKN